VLDTTVGQPLAAVVVPGEVEVCVLTHTLFKQIAYAQPREKRHASPALISTRIPMRSVGAKGVVADDHTPFCI